jgi:hypothetical protein
MAATNLGGQATSVPAAEPAANSLGLSYDAAVRKFEMLDRTFDTLNTRAAALIALSSLLLSASQGVMDRLKTHPTAQSALGVALFIAVAHLLWHCLQAYRIREVQGWPWPSEFFAMYGNWPADATRLQFISDLDMACKQNGQDCMEKTRHLEKGLWTFVLLMVVLLPLTFFLPH